MLLAAPVISLLGPAQNVCFTWERQKRGREVYAESETADEKEKTDDGCR